MLLQVRDSAAFMTCASNLAEAQGTLTRIGTIAGYAFPLSKLVVCPTVSMIYRGHKGGEAVSRIDRRGFFVSLLALQH